LDRRTLFQKAASLTAGAAAVLALPITRTAAAQTAQPSAPQSPASQRNSAMWVATTRAAPWLRDRNHPSVIMWSIGNTCSCFTPTGIPKDPG
jgi:hypothetical protein